MAQKVAASRVDWLDFAHLLSKERLRLEDSLPRGVSASLVLHDYGCGGMYDVMLSHKESGLHGHGHARTPAKAFEEAKEDLARKYAEQQRRPRLAATKALAAAKPMAALFEA